MGENIEKSPKLLNATKMCKVLCVSQDVRGLNKAEQIKAQKLGQVERHKHKKERKENKKNEIKGKRRRLQNEPHSYYPKNTCTKDFSFQREKNWTLIDVIVRHRMNPKTQALLQQLLAFICHDMFRKAFLALKPMSLFTRCAT